MVIEKNLDVSGNIWKVQLHGDVDIYNADELRAGLADIAEGDVEIDCTDLQYIDSTGLGVLVSVLKRTREKGYMVRFWGLKPHIHKIFSLTALDELFEIGVAQ